MIRPVEKLGRNIHTSTIENQTFQNVCDPQICGEEAVGPHSAKFAALRVLQLGVMTDMSVLVDIAARSQNMHLPRRVSV